MTTRITSGGPALARVVEHQMRNWELVHAQRPTTEAGPRPVHDFICISRMAGAGGSEAAHELGKRLGWPVFDREILEFMAGDDAARRQVYANMDERDVGWCEEVLHSLMHSEFARNDYLHRLCKTILSLSRQGPAVLLGRGAEHILPRDCGTRIRLVGSMAARAKRYAAAMDISLPEARERIEKLDRIRAEFLRRSFKVGPEETTPYDLVINTDRLTADQVADVILLVRKVGSAGEGKPAGTPAVGAPCVGV